MKGKDVRYGIGHLSFCEALLRNHGWLDRIGFIGGRMTQSHGNVHDLNLRLVFFLA